MESDLPEKHTTPMQGDLSSFNQAPVYQPQSRPELNLPEQESTTPSFPAASPFDNSSANSAKSAIFGKSPGRIFFNILLGLALIVLIIWVKGGFNYFKKHYVLYSNRDFATLIIDDDLTDDEIQNQVDIAFSIDRSKVGHLNPIYHFYVIGDSDKDGLMKLIDQNAYVYEIYGYLEQNALGTIYSDGIDGTFYRINQNENQILPAANSNANSI